MGTGKLAKRDEGARAQRRAAGAVGAKAGAGNGRRRMPPRRLLRCGAALTAAAVLGLAPAARILAAEAPKQTTEAEASEQTAEASGQTYVITTIEDWEEFARQAHVAAWSEGRTVRLAADLDLTGREWESIVYFGGVFDGEGHTIKGMEISSERSRAGLFDQIGREGTVRRLSVIGAVRPNGRQTVLGGIVGINRGRVEDCSWFGTVDGHDTVGGIAGKNEDTGVIAGCKSGGVIQGDSYVGGITGYNLGTVLDSRSEAQVNTVYTDVPFSMEEINVTLDSIIQTGRLSTPDNVQQKLDVGGIVGFSSGGIEGCVNTGTVGYEHVGSNVGGIAGRSTGLLKDCENRGPVFGRRDVGGVVGQQQPDLSISISEGKLGEIGAAVDKLESMIDAALTDTDNYSADTSARLKAISGLVGTAKGDVQTLTDDVNDRADRAAQQANAATEALQSSMTDFSTASKRVASYVKKVTSATKKLEEDLQVFLARVEMTESDRAALNQAMADLSQALSEMQEASAALEEAVAKGPEVSENGRAIVQQTISRLTAAYSKMGTSLGTVSGILGKYEGEEGVSELALAADVAAIGQETAPVIAGIGGSASSGTDEILNVLQPDSEAQQAFLEDLTTGKLTELLGRLDVSQAALLASLETSEDGTTKLASDAQEAAAALAAAGASEEELASLSQAVGEIQQAGAEILAQMQVLRAVRDAALADQGASYTNSEILPAVAALAEAYAGLSSAARSVTSALEGYYAQISSPEVQQARKAVKSSLAALATEMGKLPDVDPLVSNALKRVADVDLKVNGVSATARAASTDLYNAISMMISQSDALNDSLRNAASGTVGSLKDINAQIGVISDLIEDAVDELLDTSLDPEDHREDVSEEDFADAVSGRATGCVNNGRIEGDSDVGGVAGLMGVDLELEPERDIADLGNRITNATMEEKAIVDDCENNGDVVAVGNYVGGITGRMQMGIVYGCRSLGWIETEGDYAGGIAGHSRSTVRACLVKTGLKGTNYVGGVVGQGSVITGNRVMAFFKDTARDVGSIAGGLEEAVSEKISDNLWCGGDVRAIGNVDYGGQAEETDYGTIAESGAIFRELRLTFLADDEVCGVIRCANGQTPRESDIPEVPAKEGFSGKWSREDWTNVRQEDRIEAVYTRITTLIASEEEREPGKPVFYAEGAFRPEDRIQILEQGTQGGEEGGAPEEERLVLRLPSDGAEEHTLRFLPDPSMGRVELFLEDGTPVETGEIGIYQSFTAAGEEIRLRAVRRPGILERLRPYFPAACACVGGLVAIIVAVVLRRRKKRTGAVRSAAEEEGGEPGPAVEEGAGEPGSPAEEGNGERE